MSRIRMLKAAVSTHHDDWFPGLVDVDAYPELEKYCVPVAPSPAPGVEMHDQNTVREDPRMGEHLGRSRPSGANCCAPSRERLEGLGFGAALSHLQGGGRVARGGWNGKGQYLELQVPDRQSKMTLPYIFIRTVQGDLVPWLASQTDLLAYDWCVVSERTVLQYGEGGETLKA